jgi:hypothetical protein
MCIDDSPNNQALSETFPSHNTNLSIGTKWGPFSVRFALMVDMGMLDNFSAISIDGDVSPGADDMATEDNPGAIVDAAGTNLRTYLELYNLSCFFLLRKSQQNVTQPPATINHNQIRPR